MKTSCIALCCLLASASIFAQGIRFEPENNSWPQVLEKARQTNKLIFVVAYSTSCHNCQEMHDQVYPLPTVGETYNERYLNVKIDVDRAEAADFASQYGILAYPTYLFIDGQGEQVHRSMGADSAEKFIKMGQRSLLPQHQFFPLKQRFLQGDRSSVLLKDLCLMVMNLQDQSLMDTIQSAYLATQSNWLSPENQEVVLSGLHTIEQKRFSFLLKHKAAFIATYDSVKINNLIEKIVLTSLSLKSYNHEQGDFELAKAQAYAAQYLPQDVYDQYLLLFEFNQHLRKNETLAFQQKACQYFDTYPSYNPYLYHNIALAFYEQTEDQALLSKALDWSLKALALKNLYQFHDTTAALYYKLGQVATAKIHVLKALDLAKTEGIELSETLALLKKIEGK